MAKRMDPDRWRKVESIFDKVLDADKHLRDRVLEESCVGDESLRHEVESLLAQHTLAGEFIEDLFPSAWTGGNPSGGEGKQNDDENRGGETSPVKRLWGR